MIKYIFTVNNVTLTLTEYESQNYPCSIHFLVLDSDITFSMYLKSEFVNFYRVACNLANCYVCENSN